MQRSQLYASGHKEYCIVFRNGFFRQIRKILIIQATSTDKWYHGFWVDKSGQIRDGYIYRPSLTVTTDDFFRLDGEKAWYPWIAAALLGGLIVFMRKGSYSWIWTFCLSLLFIFTLYQALERLLFNVMLLNLPG